MILYNADVYVPSGGVGQVGIAFGGFMQLNGGTTLESTDSIVGINAGSVGHATVIQTNSLWDNSGTLIVGSSGTGQLTVTSGGRVRDTVGTLGLSSSGVGSATVTGTNSTWYNSLELTVGYAGIGQLTVSNGGQVLNTNGVVGHVADSNGAVTVTGTDSLWDNSGYLLIGNGPDAAGAASGQLDINGGGRVNNTFGRVGVGGDSNGSVIVTGSGSLWNNSSTLDVGASGTGQMEIGPGAQVKNTVGTVGGTVGGNTSSHGSVTVSGFLARWDNSSLLFVGNVGTGQLTISDGGRVNDIGGYLGYSASGDGSATVTGTNSLWNNSGSLSVGRDGSGQLEISAGAQVVNTTAILGRSTTGNGSATVTGTGTLWNNGELDVGLGGTGRLTVSGGGRVNSTAGFVGLQAGSNGSATVTGVGSWWNNSGNLFVGYHSTGQLTVSDGGRVDNTNSSLGILATGIGSVTVSGTGSLWNNSAILKVGDEGAAHLTISNGGQVNNTIGYLGFVDTGNGDATVAGPGSLWNNSNELNVGYAGTGQLTVSGGGRVDNTAGFLGWTATGDGAATVTGTGSLWNNSSALLVGFQGTGQLTIRDGAQVNNTTGEVGYVAAANGSVTVTGPGSLWNNSSQIRIGAEGAGQLMISGGGRVNNTVVFLADGATSSGAATVTGTGSLWNNSSALVVGTRSAGQLTISDGGRVSNTAGILGAYAGADGSVAVTGAGTVWDNSQDLAIGGTASAAGGSGVLAVNSGGVVNVAGALRIWSGGALYLDDGGTINAGRLERLAGAGPADLNAGQLNLLGTGSNLGTALTIGDGTSAQATLRMATGAGAAVGTLSLASDGVLHLDGGSLTATSVDATVGTILWNRGELHVAGGNSLVPQGLAVPNFSLLAGNGDLAGPISGAPQSTIRAEGGSLALGVSNSFLGFNHAGVVDVGGNSMTLRSLGFANLGVLTTMSTGGSLTAANGIALDAGDNFQGAGTISARVAQRVGSTIQATGNLTLGSASAVDGYVGEGVLQTGTNTVTLLDSNQAVLGSLTTLGSGSTPGTLAAANGAVVDFGHNVTGVGLMSTPNNPLNPLIINGSLQGASATDRITLSGYVKGVGTWDNVNVTGTDAPGFSPAAVDRGSVSYNGTLQIELGGLIPGSGYDQLNHVLGAGIADLGGTLDVDLLGGFTPTIGDVFVLATYASHTGQFSALDLPPLASNLAWSLDYNSTSVTLSVTSTRLPGDANGDNQVNRADLALVVRSYGLVGAVWSNGDFDGNGRVDLSDVTILQSHFGQSVMAPSASAAVPEPSSIVLVLVGLIATGVFRRFHNVRE